MRTRTGFLITPTGSSLGTVTADELSSVDLTGRHLAGPRPSKEAPLHAALFTARPAGECGGAHPLDSLSRRLMPGRRRPRRRAAPLTAYFAMRVGRLPLLPYFPPGHRALSEAAERAAADHHALLMRNHGPIVAGPTLNAALDCLEEVEETAKLFLLLRGLPTRPLSADQVEALAPAVGTRPASAVTP